MKMISIRTGLKMSKKKQKMRNLKISRNLWFSRILEVAYKDTREDLRLYHSTTPVLCLVSQLLLLNNSNNGTKTF